MVWVVSRKPGLFAALFGGWFISFDISTWRDDDDLRSRAVVQKQAFQDYEASEEPPDVLPMQVLQKCRG